LSGNISAVISGKNTHNSLFNYSFTDTINIIDTINTFNSFNSLSLFKPLSPLTLFNSYNHLSYRILPIDGNIFYNEQGKYDVKKVYDYINIDPDKIEYSEDSEEFNRLVNILTKHTPAYKNDNRIFSWFHQLHGEEREMFTLNNSPLREAFDVPACNFCILAKLLETTDVSKKELSAFQNLVRYDYIYKKIAEHARN
jgi:hypothetical protein